MTVRLLDRLAPQFVVQNPSLESVVIVRIINMLFLTCIYKYLDCTNGEMRIVQRSNQIYPQYTVGRIELCVNGSWGKICGDFFDNSDASVFCRQMGYSPLGED